MMDLIAAILLDLLIGDPYWFKHPVIYIGKLIRVLDKLGRKLCKTHKQIKIFGGVIVVIVAFSSFLVPFIILKISKELFWVYNILNIILLWTTIATRCLHTEGIKVYDALVKDDIDDARIKLSYIVGRDTKDLCVDEIIRADVETIAENTADGVIAPILYAILGGAPLAMMYKGINTMDSMLGYMNEKYKYIGFFPAKTDDVFNYVPARLTGFLICLAAPIVRGNILDSIKVMIRDRKNHKSPNCAYPEGAVAGAMRVQLGGTNVYFGEKMYKPTIGNRIKDLGREHIVDTIKLMYGSLFYITLICVIYEICRYI
ncbi:adenosylcobinamide-phosphate synthase CbiB [Clostridium estertheticum]|uniref:adenosylcobinamide-phosphate synthase CbiB n=1 Tax=Clostridium estertheticum TaxID=238834 RepID=UPI0014723808|nr:adenosylcobinamide-phosphate synthase CbiB [Clostridium estertheticum]MBU3075907.1 adenosylcobinamide-phosphate synthase CbiB [Clostridium estertheticum]MBU3165869.1 adenosylcobinamide-phosphate synthase CbiB [Clostridium estertheticum]